jgi:hypothetical protein
VILVAHRILIGAAILFGVYYAGWEVTAFRRTGAAWHLAIALVTGAVTAALGYYLWNLRRFLR